MKKFLIVAPFLLLCLITLIIANTRYKQSKTIPSSIPTNKIEEELYNYISQDYNPYDVSYTVVSTIITPIYEYTPYTIDTYSMDIARLEFTIPTAFSNDTTYLRDKQSHLYELLKQAMPSNVKHIDSIRRQTDWLIVHTYQLTPHETSTPFMTCTRTFYTDIDSNNLREISNMSGNILKQHDTIIENIINNGQY